MWGIALRFLGLAAAAYALASCGSEEEGGGDPVDGGNKYVPDASDNHPPQCGTNSDIYVNVGDTISQSLPASDPDGDNIIYNPLYLPAGASLSSSGIFSWKPTSGQAGQYTIPFSASDGTATVNCEVAVNVVEGVTPVLSPISEVVTEGQKLMFQMPAHDQSGVSITWSVSDLPLGASFNSVTRQFEWTPCHNASGSHSVQFIAVSGDGGSATVPVQITVLDDTSHDLIAVETGGKPMSDCGEASLSGDGRYVVFTCEGPGDESNVFLHDRQTCITTPVNDPAVSAASPFISSNGAFVAHTVWSGASGQYVVRRNLSTGGNAVVSVDLAGNPAESSGAQLVYEKSPASSDGNLILFESQAPNMVGWSGHARDVYLRNMLTGMTQLVSSLSLTDNSFYVNGIDLSDNGRYAVYVFANNGGGPSTQDVMLFDRQTGSTEQVDLPSDGHASWNPRVSGDGRFVVYSSDKSNLVPGDSNQESDIFLKDRQSGNTERLSVNDMGGETSGGESSAYPAISSDGRFVVFTSYSPNLDSTLPPSPTGGTYVRDRWHNTTRRISDWMEYPRISADGGFVAIGEYVVPLSNFFDL